MAERREAGGLGVIKYIWAALIVIGIVVGVATGKAELVSSTIMQSAKDAAALSLSLLGVYCLWLGLLNIAQEAGMIKSLAKRAEKLLLKLFRGLKQGSEALGYVTLNLIANMLGMGNAATPFGLKAMSALQELNPKKDRPSDDMCLFIIINTASVQLLPLTIIAVRSAAGSQNPAEIVVTAFLATLATAIFGIIGAKICAGRKKP